MKIYRKTTIVNAEQFDGSNEMAKRYGAELYSESGYGYDAVEGEPDGDGYVLITPEGESLVRTGDWISTGVNGEHLTITDDVFKKSYAELPVIPKNVANYLTDCKRAKTTIGTSLSGNIVLFGHARTHDMIHDILSWLCPSDNQDLFARAWLDGFQTEEEK